MALIEGWLPPSRTNWELLVFYFQFFPLVRHALSTKAIPS